MLVGSDLAFALLNWSPREKTAQTVDAVTSQA